MGHTYPLGERLFSKYSENYLKKVEELKKSSYYYVNVCSNF
jgi:hypothetical protein